MANLPIKLQKCWFPVLRILAQDRLSTPVRAHAWVLGGVDVCCQQSDTIKHIYSSAIKEMREYSVQARDCHQPYTLRTRP